MVLYCVNYSKLESKFPQFASLYSFGLRWATGKICARFGRRKRSSSHYSLKIGAAWQVPLKHRIIVSALLAPMTEYALSSLWLCSICWYAALTRKTHFNFYVCPHASFLKCRKKSHTVHKICGNEATGSWLIMIRVSAALRSIPLQFSISRGHIYLWSDGSLSHQSGAIVTTPGREKGKVSKLGDY